MPDWEPKPQIETGIPLKPMEYLKQLGDRAVSQNPFVVEVGKVDLAKERLDEKLTQPITSGIKWQDSNKGIGYLPSSEKQDRQQEVVAAALIADAFETRETKTTPLIIPVDKFYRFFPGNPSFVTKTQIFEEQLPHPKKEYALILTGFSDSCIFTQDSLEQIPTQKNAGLVEDESEERSKFGRRLMDFASVKLRLWLNEENGDIAKVLLRLAPKEEDRLNARLLLATSFLLQDMQLWQSLWYESAKRGTALYIVAPQSFHDAMNRINFHWGHGVRDYSYRASGSLGNNGDEPLFGEKDDLSSYSEQGIPFEDFKERVERFL